MTSTLSCADYLATLSEPQLRCWVRLNLSYDQIANVWSSIRKNLMKEDLQSGHLSNFLTRLCAHYDQNELRQVLAKEVKQNYQFLPNDHELQQIKLDLINKAKVEKLATLDLSCFLIKNLPDELFALSHLENLYLAGNLIETIPDNISFLKSLILLDLYKNNIFFLSHNISQLLNLKSLYLSNNLLSTLPSQIGYLSSLQVIDLHNNLLSNLPSQIGSLSKLQTLILSNNKFSSLPDEIGFLFNLQGISLSENKLTSLPTTLNLLYNLKLLSLYNNKLTNLPSGIGLLSNLQFLDLSYNNLTSLINEIGSLHNLEFLSLSNNNLSTLPSDIKQLTLLKILMLQGNHSLPIPPEILRLHNEPTKILNYYFDILNSEKEVRKLNEAKMLVVGEGKVGKTSLVNRLVRNIFNDSESMTEGVIIEKHWPIKLADGREIKVNIWDFGGQEIMHSTHQFFLTKRSLYLLVLDGRHDEQQNRLDYWLKTIENFADDAPIIVVCNQIDIKTLELDRKGLRAKYNIKAFVEISCKTAKGIDSLTQAITEQLGELKHIDDLLLSSWFKIKQQLEIIQNNHQDYLEYSEYKQMCVKENIDTLSEETLIGFLHDLGVVLCFHKDPRVKTTQILNPDWVTAGVYKILNYRGLAINKGELQISCLNDVLNDIRYPENKHFFIIEMMRKFELCFDLDDSSRDKLLIPDLLPKEAPNLSDLENWQDTLRVEYHYDLLPSSVISRFIVRMNAFIYDKTYWRYGVVLNSKDKRNKALIKADLDAKKIFIFVNGREASRKELLSIVFAEFDKIYATIPRLQVSEKIPLPNRPTITTDYKHLLVLQEKRVTHFIPEGHDDLVSVDELLGTIDKTPILKTNHYHYDIETISHSVSRIEKTLNHVVNTVSASPIIESNKSSQLNQSNQSSTNTINQQNNSNTATPKEIANMPETATKPIYILHLSDIHLGTVDQGSIYYNQLQLDLKQNLKLDKLDYLIISGDIANKSTTDEYEAAFELVNNIKLGFKVENEQVIIVPGNHDLSWDLSEEAYVYVASHKLPSPLPEDYVQIPGGALRRDKDKYKKRFDNFANFYRKVCGNKAYPSDYEDQAVLHTFPDHKALFLALNSAWDIDHLNTNRANINQVALGKAISDSTKDSFKDWLKIAIWHHPITTQEMMNNHFVEQLAVAGFEICLHGHIHEAIEDFYKYDNRRGLAIIGGGTFGAPTKTQVTSIPLQYNLLILEPNKASITVKSRKKEKVEGAWSADARWGDKEEPKAFYTITLKKGVNQNP